MPKKFEKSSISFQYPDNWELDEEVGRSGHKSVTVSSPGGAFWSVAVLPLSADPKQMAEVVVEAIKDEYPETEAYAAIETILGHELQGYDMNFPCLDMINSAQVRCVSMAKNNYTIFCQGEDRDFEKSRLVFSAMTTSLLQELDAAL
jgi:hypothetical protein